MAERKPNRMSVEEFLAWEQEQDLRYELVDGLPMAMTGGTSAHDQVRIRIASALLTQLRDKPCRAALDMKIVCPSGAVRYPDAQVDCGRTTPRAVTTERPVFVVEVLSDSTRATDLFVKIRDYESVQSIDCYAIFWQDQPLAEVYFREGPLFGASLKYQGLDAVLAPPSLDLTLRFADLYDWLPAL